MPIVCAKFVWLMGMTSTWAHNLFVSWAFVFSTVGGPMLGKPKYNSISSSLSLSLIGSLLCSLSVFAFFSQLSSQNCQPPFLILIFYLQLKISGKVMITFMVSGKGGPMLLSLSGYLVRSGRQQEWHWNQFPHQKISLAVIFPRQYRASWDLPSREIAFPDQAVSHLCRSCHNGFITVFGPWMGVKGRLGQVCRPISTHNHVQCPKA